MFHIIIIRIIECLAYTLLPPTNAKATDEATQGEMAGLLSLRERIEVRVNPTMNGLGQGRPSLSVDANSAAYYHPSATTEGNAGKREVTTMAPRIAEPPHPHNL